MPASVISTEHLGARLFIKAYDHDPGSTSAILASPDGGTTIRSLDMRDYEQFGVMVRPTIVAAGGVTRVEIVMSATTSFGTVAVVKDSGVIAADSLNDTVFLEVSAEEVAQQATDDGVAYRYVAARITNATATDEADVIYIGVPKRPVSGLTATSIT